MKKVWDDNTLIFLDGGEGLDHGNFHIVFIITVIFLQWTYTIFTIQKNEFVYILKKTRPDIDFSILFLDNTTT